MSTDIPDDLQKRYICWKKNAKLLYEYLNTNTTKWPSLSCQFFPDLNTTTDMHRILMTSFTSSQQPEDEAIHIQELSTMNHIPWASLDNFDMDDMEFKIDNQTKFPNKNLLETVIIHFPGGDCNRARYMPQNPDVIGTVSSNGSTYIFDRTKYGSKRSSLLEKSSKYEIELFEKSASGISTEALALAWNRQKEGILATSYDDGGIKIWDITKYNKYQPRITSSVLDKYLDGNGTNDLSWMVHHSSILAGCGEGNTLGLLDIRTPHEFTPINVYHNKGINAVQFNYENDMLLCSADHSGLCHLWDIRSFELPLKSFTHKDSVSTIEWNPNKPAILATAGQNDGLVKIWDTATDDPSLVFVHGGHIFGVNDISWNLHNPWTMCSVSNDNSIHVWKPAASIVG